MVTAVRPGWCGSMSDLHHLPLTGHDMPHKPVVRARVYKRWGGWGWAFLAANGISGAASHGPFDSWREAYDSARRVCEQL